MRPVRNGHRQPGESRRARPRGSAGGKWRAASLAASLLLTSCMVGPDYRRPPAPVPASFKELAGWKPATPSDAADKGVWWSAFDDPLLDGLEQRVDINNQTVKAAEAAYRNAQALVEQARAGLFPTASFTSSVTRGATGIGSNSPRTIYTLQGSADWTLDVWGRIRRQVESNVAGAQVSAADLANARLSAQASLATFYFELRTEDALQRLLDQTVRNYEASLRITSNQYAAGVAARSDVITAETQLESAQSQAIATGIARAQFEHAIAVLTGVPPAELTIPPGPLAMTTPEIPPMVPARLLERRPDIAAAERVMAAQNAQIGVAVASFYPDISLSALYGFSGDPLSSLISTSHRVWTIAASGNEVLFEGGLRTAEVAAARANYDQSVANYRETVLTAFQQVEDELAALRILAQQAEVQAKAVASAEQAALIALNEYRAGTQAYTTVVTAQNAALANEETALTIQRDRLTASVTLIEALGGGWSDAALPSKASLQSDNPLVPAFLESPGR